MQPDSSHIVSQNVIIYYNYFIFRNLCYIIKMLKVYRIHAYFLSFE